MSHVVANRMEPATTLQPAQAPAPAGTAALWSGRVISILPALFLLWSGLPQRNARLRAVLRGSR